MLGDVLPNITSGGFSPAPNNRRASGSERRRIESTDMAAAPEIDAHVVAHKKHRNYKCLKEWSEWQDSNLRPLRPERSALPG